MTTTGLHLRQKFAAAILTASGVSPEPGSELEDVIPILVYRDRSGRRSFEIGPRNQIPMREVQAILRDAADSIKVKS